MEGALEKNKFCSVGKLNINENSFFFALTSVIKL